MDKKIIVNEMGGRIDIILGMFFGFIIAILSFMVGIKLSDMFPDIPIAFGLLTLLILLVGPMSIFMYFWFKIRRKRTAVTPILHVDEKIPISQEKKEILDGVEGAQNLQGLITGSGGLLTEIAKSAMISAAKRDTHVKYTLCEEGIVVYQKSSGNLCRWNRIRKLTVDPKNKRFEFTVRGGIGKWNIITPNKFEETKQVLSKYIEVH